jgi:hypothetical protein
LPTALPPRRALACRLRLARLARNAAARGSSSLSGLSKAFPDSLGLSFIAFNPSESLTTGYRHTHRSGQDSLAEASSVWPPIRSESVLTGPLARPYGLWHHARLDNRCRSSGVEHSLGKGEVESSNLSGSTRANRKADWRKKRQASAQQMPRALNSDISDHSISSPSRDRSVPLAQPLFAVFPLHSHQTSR